MLDLSYDEQISQCYPIVCGTDEAGRGPLAGPVVAAAVVLPRGCVISGLDDSKKLSEKKREALFDLIIKECIAYGIAMCSPEEIDEMNILQASLTAMKRAVSETERIIKPDIILVDGNRLTDFQIPSKAVVHGDALSQSIAAASVLAKVTRDRIMIKEDEEYPEYGFAGHKGYPTPSHKLAVYEHGPCAIHRRSFLSFLEKDKAKLESALEKKRAGIKA